jgi:hypothetical protein
MDNKVLDFKFTVAEINTVLQCLGQLPFVQVVDLINAVKQQAAPQMHHDMTKDAETKN